jgi:hypothetical protein
VFTLAQLLQDEIAKHHAQAEAEQLAAQQAA